MVWTNLPAETALSADLTQRALETHRQRFQLIQPKYKISLNLPNKFCEAQYFLIFGTAL